MDTPSSEERDLAWLSLMTRSGMGELSFCVTENGDIGVFGVDGAALGTGDTAGEALSDAHRSWHEGGLPEQKTACACVEHDLDGEDINAYSPPRAPV